MHDTCWTRLRPLPFTIAVVVCLLLAVSTSRADCKDDERDARGDCPGPARPPAPPRARKPDTTPRLIALIHRGDIADAIALAKKGDFNAPRARSAVMLAFPSWIKAATEQAAKRGPRGECSAVAKLETTYYDWSRLLLAIMLKHVGVPVRELDHMRQIKWTETQEDEVDAGMDAFTENAEPLFAPIHNAGEACLAAIKHDGAAQIAAARDANRAGLAKCVTSVAKPLAARVVVDVLGIPFLMDLTWPTDTDADVQFKSWKCFHDEISKWRFKPTTTGFAATVSLAE